jgi:hypothetical protein
MREKFGKQPIDFGKVSVQAATTKRLPCNMLAVLEEPFNIEMSTSKGVKITEYHPGASSARWAAIAKFS